ncbi:MAG: alanyl-tRNA editing protein, partial [Chloroflexi bacterium]|nr:alanyl-tRNA editing protein [Chloroflexota bacterium]
MTERLYYNDAYTTRFQAHVVERLTHQGRPAVVLDQTYFYPTSGGQPFDQGHLGGTPVIDVFVRDSDQAVIHVLGGEVWVDEIAAEVAWARRFDHMQQHTGQHILSQAFIQAAGAETVSFHLGDESCTVDLHVNQLAAAQIEQAELLANQIIWENRPVRATMVSQEQAARLPLRKVPPLEGDKLRVVEIKNFDLTACGGTHVSHTGEIGMIKIVKLERRGAELRVEFKCGQRALHDYRLKNSIINRLAAELTTGYLELEPTVTRMRDELKELRRVLKQQQTQLLSLEA